MLQDVTIHTADEFQRLCDEDWNAEERPPLHEWLSSTLSEEDGQRLHSLGNVVFPRFGHFAVSLIDQSIRD